VNYNGNNKTFFKEIETYQSSKESCRGPLLGYSEDFWKKKSLPLETQSSGEKELAQK